MELIRVQDSDYRKTYELYMSFPESENGYMNNVYGYDYDRFLEWIDKKRNWSLGKELPEGFVADTTYVLADNAFDVTLVFGPLYHLYEKEEVEKAIDEAIRVTKKDGIILFAFISVFAIMYSNYFTGNWGAGQEENFTQDYKVRHFKEQLFTGYDVAEFEDLFLEKRSHGSPPRGWMAL